MQKPSVTHYVMQSARRLRDQVRVLVVGEVHHHLNQVGQRAAVEWQDRKGLLESLHGTVIYMVHLRS